MGIIALQLSLLRISLHLEKTNILKRLEEIGLNQKWRNSWAKERRSNNLTYAKSQSQSKQIVNKLSGPREAGDFGDRMENARNMVLESENGHDRLGIYGSKDEFKAILAGLHKFLKKEGEIYEELKAVCYTERDRRRVLKEQIEAEREQALNDRISTAEEASGYDDGVDADDDFLDTLGV